MDLYIRFHTFQTLYDLGISLSQPNQNGFHPQYFPKIHRKFKKCQIIMKLWKIL